MFSTRLLRSALSVSALCIGLAAYADAPTKLKLLPTDATEKLGGYRPQKLTLSAAKPVGVKKIPAGITTPLYGVLKMGDKAKPTTITVLVDETKGKVSRLFVDTNGNGDFTDEPKTEWAARPYSETAKGHFGGAMVKVGANSLHLGMFRFDPTDPDRAKYKTTLFYFSDYAYEGKIQLGDATYNVLLTDDNATGDFRGVKSKDEEAGSGVRLLIDVNGNGRFDRRGEAYDIAKPFNIKGTTYEVKNVAALGGTFEVVKSDKTVAEILPPADLSRGKTALNFEAKTMDGKAVKFPSDFKGKLVMLDFWATWCGPCRGEIPGLVKTYGVYHSQNFEILGISLDNKGDDKKITDYTEQTKMSWAQVFDGKAWQADVAQMYVVESIPQAYLVDGDTGEIVAEGEELRGESLEGTLKTALAKKNKKE